MIKRWGLLLAVCLFSVSVVFLFLFTLNSAVAQSALPALPDGYYYDVADVSFVSTYHMTNMTHDEGEGFAEVEFDSYQTNYSCEVRWDISLSNWTGANPAVGIAFQMYEDTFQSWIRIDNSQFATTVLPKTVIKFKNTEMALDGIGFDYDFPVASVDGTWRFMNDAVSYNNCANFDDRVWEIDNVMVVREGYPPTPTSVPEGSGLLPGGACVITSVSGIGYSQTVVTEVYDINLLRNGSFESGWSGWTIGTDISGSSVRINSSHSTYQNTPGAHGDQWWLILAAEQYGPAGVHIFQNTQVMADSPMMLTCYTSGLGDIDPGALKYEINDARYGNTLASGTLEQFDHASWTSGIIGPVNSGTQTNYSLNIRPIQVDLAANGLPNSGGVDDCVLGRLNSMSLTDLYCGPLEPYEGLEPVLLGTVEPLPTLQNTPTPGPWVPTVPLPIEITPHPTSCYGWDEVGIEDSPFLEWLSGSVGIPLPGEVPSYNMCFKPSQLGVAEDDIVSDFVDGGILVFFTPVLVGLFALLVVGLVRRR